MVTPRQLLSTSRGFEAGRYPDHVHERLRVVARDLGRTRILLAVLGVAEAQPVPHPPAGALAHDRDPLTLGDPLGEVEVGGSGPGNAGQRHTPGSGRLPLCRRDHRQALVRAASVSLLTLQRG